jgi:hypothetical protein
VGPARWARVRASCSLRRSGSATGNGEWSEGEGDQGESGDLVEHNYFSSTRLPTRGSISVEHKGRGRGFAEGLLFMLRAPYSSAGGLAQTFVMHHDALVICAHVPGACRRLRLLGAVQTAAQKRGSVSYLFPPPPRYAVVCRFRAIVSRELHLMLIDAASPRSLASPRWSVDRFRTAWTPDKH